MLKTRVITAIVGICIAIGAITYGGFLYNSLVALLAIVGWREFLVMNSLMCGAIRLSL